MSRLRTALQFRAVDQLRAQFTAQPRQEQERKITENEKLYTGWLVQLCPGEPCLQAVAGKVLAYSRTEPNFNMTMFEGICALSLGWRADSLTSVTPSHRPLSPDGIRNALARFFEWTGEQAFAELHPVEQSALSLPRLLEIGPFARLNVPLSGALSCFWLLRSGFIFPIWRYYQPGKYEECLEAAFRLDMQPLVDHLLRGEHEAFRVTFAP
ncbi:MAG: hypothetical protein HY644_10795 [Acidobacteria bacterium]|nr:hypothetical protein [Acidobacteriota bacterium]